MMDSIETLLKWKQYNGVNPDQAESAYIKQIIKEIAKTFPNEWELAVKELTQENL